VSSKLSMRTIVKLSQFSTLQFQLKIIE